MNDQANPDSEAKAPPARRRPRLWLALPLAVVLQVLLLALLLAAWVLGTQSGLRALLALVDDLAPGLVQVQQAEGRLLGDLRLEGVAVRAPGLSADLGELRLAWAPLAAVAGTLRVEELALSDLDLVIAPSEEEDTTRLELPSIFLPVGIELERVRVERASIAQPGGEVFRIDHLGLKASLRGSELVLREFTAGLPEPAVAARAEGRAELSGDYPLTAALGWSLVLPAGAELAGWGEVVGDLKRLTLAHEVSGAVQAGLEAELRDLLDHPRWDGTLALAGVDLPAFAEGLPALALSGRLATRGDLDEARVEGRLDGRAPDLPELGPLAATLDLTWRDQVLRLAALELREDGSGALLTATGELDLGSTDGRFDLRAAWEGLRWPLAGDALAESRQGRLDAQGSLADFRYALEAEVWGADFPAAGLSLNGEGDRDGTRIGELQIDTLDGRINGSGSLAWSPDLVWDLELTGEGLDPGRQWPGLDGRVGVGLTSSGGLDGYTYRVDGGIDSQALPAAAVRLVGEGDLAGTRIGSLRIDTLGGRIEGDGVVGWGPALTWEASLSAVDIDPGTQWAEWSGRLGGRVASEGRLDDSGPDFRLAIDGVQGELRGFPVAADAEVAGQGGAIRVEDLLVTLGPSRLEAKGELAEDRLRLAFELDSPDLSTLMPQARGRFEASGTASGTPNAPEVRVELASLL